MILFLSDIAGSEVLLILVFVLMFFGSKSIPGLAKTMGRTMRQIKDASQDLQNEIKKSGIDIKNDLNINRMIEETVEDFERPFQEQAREMNAAVSFEPPMVFEMPENPIPAKTTALIEEQLENQLEEKTEDIDIEDTSDQINASVLETELDSDKSTEKQ